MSADSLYYIYYTRDDEEPHFIFIAYSFTCSHLRHLPASTFYHNYDVNYDNRAGFLLAIQYASIYSAAFCGQSY